MPIKKTERLLRKDPSRTTLLRRRFLAEVNRRFGEFRALVRAAIVDRDCLGLKNNTLAGNIDISKLPDAKEYAFRTSSAKIEGFMSWLEQQERDGLLEITRGSGIGTGVWSDMYIESAYKRGISRAYTEMDKKRMLPTGAEPFLKSSMLSPIHADRVGLLATRTYESLKGVTAEMSKQISQVLSQGMVDGLGPVEMARGITDRIDAIGRTRARTIARTEVMRAHHVATIESYKEAGVQGVKVLAEWSTAGDDAVCELCESMEGKVYSLDEATGMLPRHPNCRCVMLPMLPDEKIEKEKGVGEKVVEEEKMNWAVGKDIDKATKLGVKYQKENEVVWLSPKEVMERMEPDFRLYPDVGTNRIGNRLEKIQGEIKKGQFFDPPILGPSYKDTGQLMINDGRHRTLAAMLQGEKKIPFLISRESMEEVLGRLPTSVVKVVQKSAGTPLTKGKVMDNDTWNKLGFTGVSGDTQTIEILGKEAVRIADQSMEMRMAMFGPRSNAKGTLVLEDSKYLSGTKATTGGYSRDTGVMRLAIKGRKMGEDRVPRLGAFNVGGGSLNSSFRHELGHKIYYNIAYRDALENKSTFKQEWSDLWNLIGRKKGGIKKNISQYAATNEKEMFAESFAAWVNPLYGEMGSRKLPEEVEEFLNKWLKPTTGELKQAVKLPVAEKGKVWKSVSASTDYDVMKDQWKDIGFMAPSTGELKQAANGYNALGQEATRLLNDTPRMTPYFQKVNGTAHLDNVKYLGGKQGVAGNYGNGRIELAIKGRTWDKDTLSLGQWNVNGNNDLKGLFRHELGHKVFDAGRSLDGNFGKEWGIVQRRTIGLRKGVSEYAGTNYHEAFAECFSAYTSPLYKPGSLPVDIENFFNKWFK